MDYTKGKVSRFEIFITDYCVLALHRMLESAVGDLHSDERRLDEFFDWD